MDWPSHTKCNMLCGECTTGQPFWVQRAKLFLLNTIFSPSISYTTLKCGIVNVYHVADLSQLFYQRFYCYDRVLLQCFTWCLLLYERLAFCDWLRVLTTECTFKFRKLRMAEYPYRTSSVMERPPSNFECPLQATKQIRRVQWQTTRLPVTRTSHCSQPSREREDCAVFLLIFRNWLWVVDGRTHSKFHRLRILDFFYTVGESLLGDDK